MAFSTAKSSAQLNFQNSALSAARKGSRTLVMPKRGPHKPKQPPSKPQWRRTFLKEWRIFRGYTVEDLAEKAKMSAGNISAIENRKQGFSSEGLEKLADALEITWGMLLDVDPSKEPAMWALWQRATPEQRANITAVTKALVGVDEETTP